jgi:hypothetical protein
MSSSSPLELITVPVPCQASWDGMRGTDRVRYCSKCRQQVYNLSEMTREAAEALVTGTEGRLCVRFFRRPDGTIITGDCRARLRAFRRALGGGLGLAAGLLLCLLSWASDRMGRGSSGEWESVQLRDVEPFRTIMSWMNPRQRTMTMGAICPLAPPTPGLTGNGDGQKEPGPTQEGTAPD